MERRLNFNVVLNEWKEAEDWQEIKIYGKQFLLLMLMSFLLIMVIGIAAYLRHNMLSEHVLSESAAQEAQVDQQQLQGLLAEELAYYRVHQQMDNKSLQGLGIGLLEHLTDTSLLNPAAIVSSELLYHTVDKQAMKLFSGDGLEENGATKDVAQENNKHNSNEQSQLPITGSNGEDKKDSQPANAGSLTDGASDKNEGNLLANSNKPVAFIYHSHNRESWYEEISDGDRNAQSSQKNITLVGQRLAEELEKLGVSTLVSDTDYPTAVPDYEWVYSYKYSRKTVKEAIASADSLQYIFDIHRDSQARKYTTAEINGESYAQVYFIIGQRNPNWKENESFARKLHDKIEEKYPGLSRGIWGKDPSSGNAEYNQSLFSQSVLIEIGGVDNNLEESYRTAKALAEVIAELHNETQ